MNLGENRYSFAQQMVYQTRLAPAFDVMLAGDVQVFTENDDYSPYHLKLEKAPLYSSQVSLMYNFDAKTMLGLSAYYHVGGEESWNGVEQDNETKRSRYSLTLNKKTDFGKFGIQYGSDFATENGLIEDHQIYLRWTTGWK